MELRNNAKPIIRNSTQNSTNSHHPFFLTDVKHPWWCVSARALSVVGIARGLAQDVIDEQHQQHESHLDGVISFKEG